METFITLLIPALLAMLLVRLILLPLRLILKISIHSGCGFLCLWLLNTLSSFTGFVFPINAVTVYTAGTLGLPGIGLIAILAII